MSIRSAESTGGATPFYLNILNFDGDIAAGNVTSALHGSGINLTGSGITAGDIATVLNGMDVSDLPADGTVYSVTNLGGGFENVYQAIPGTDGAAATITDTLMTPNGDIDLSSLFGTWDATAPLDIGDALNGVSTATSSSFDLFDPSTWF